MDADVIQEWSGAWDVIIVGTGMGGAVVGRRLTELGKHVLFLEKGHAINAASTAEAAMLKDPEERKSAGHWPHPFQAEIGGKTAELYAALGCGVGGSTLLYSAALERLEPHDVDDIAEAPHPTGGWPISYDELVPYYDDAERLLSVRGTGYAGGGGDWLARRPPPMREADAVLMADLAQVGFLPYRLHVGIKYKPGCRECLGFPCPQECKMDAKTCGVDPALAGGAQILTDAEVEEIEADSESVTGLIYRKGGQRFRVRAPVIIVAAGTLGSAPLLLKSKSPLWPDGLANGSGLVGRNLMFHGDDWIALWPSRKASKSGPAKTIGSRAIYRHSGVRIGMLQSTGLSAGYGNILLFMYQWFDQSLIRNLKLLRPFLRLPAKVAEKVFGAATILALIIEDLPFPDNRIELDGHDRITIYYQFRQEFRSRGAFARSLMRAMLGRIRAFWLWPEPKLNMGHPMGTCRFGANPSSSVLDRNCKAHQLTNLYVVDGSFMPTSGGVNPSLTIAANALRVAEAVASKIDEVRLLHSRKQAAQQP